MSNEIRIQPPGEQVTRGEPMMVPITVVLDRPLKVRGIHATFHGGEETKATYTTTSTDSQGRTTTQTHTAVEHVDITKQDQLIAGSEKLGFFGSLADALATLFGGGKHQTMQPGEHPFEIEILVPEDAPPTHVGKKTRVFYELSVRADVPAAFDLKAEQSFTLPSLPHDFQANPVRTRYPDDAGRGFFDALLTPEVKIEMALAADKFRLGDSIRGIFTLQPEKPISCQSIRVRLVGIETSEARGHTDRHVHEGETVELGTPGTLNGPYSQEFTLTAATHAPLSARGQLFSIDWFVQVELDVPWAKDPKIRAPIALFPA